VRRGECGACTVLLDGQAILACLTPAAAAHGRSVVTIEGVARDRRAGPLQQAFVEAGAVQCGFCTPGLVMSATALLEGNPHPDAATIREAVSGNLCRCTGYAPIVDAVALAARRAAEGAADRVILRPGSRLPQPRASLRPKDLRRCRASSHSRPRHDPASARRPLGPRVDALPKVLGQALYPADRSLPGVCHAAVIFAGRPRARILAIDPRPRWP